MGIISIVRILNSILKSNIGNLLLFSLHIAFLPLPLKEQQSRDGRFLSPSLHRTKREGKIEKGLVCSLTKINAMQLISNDLYVRLLAALILPAELSFMEYFLFDSNDQCFTSVIRDINSATTAFNIKAMCLQIGYFKMLIFSTLAILAMWSRIQLKSKKQSERQKIIAQKMKQ